MIRMLFLLITILVVTATHSPRLFAQQSLNEEQLSEWLEVATKDILSFHFGNYDEKNEASQIYFTDYGHKHFAKALKMARYKDMVEANRMVLETTVLCPPQIQVTDKKDWMEGKPNNIWQAEFPIEMVWMSGNKTRKEYQIIETILSDNNKNHPENLGIEQWVGRLADGNKKPDCASDS